MLAAPRLMTLTAIPLFVLTLGLGAPARAQVACGDVLGPGGTFVATANIGPCAQDPAVSIVGPVKVDFAGFDVSCDALTKIGVAITGTRAKVVNGSISGCLDGVRVGGEGRHQLSHLVSRNHDDDGFETHSERNTFTFNTAADNGDQGFVVTCSLGCLTTGDQQTFVHNVSTRNRDRGFNVNSNRNRLDQNVSNNDGDTCFDVDGDNNWLNRNMASACGNVESCFDVDGDNNRLSRNMASDCGHRGFEATGNTNLLRDNVAADSFVGFSLRGDDNTLLGNTAVNATTIGFFLTKGDRYRATNNHATSNNGDGFLIQFGTTSDVLTKNHAMNNTGKGVFMQGTDSRLTNNVALGNTSPDMEDDNPACDANVWKNNTFATSAVDGGANPGCLE